jgi:4,5-dihydroxyphthalate decarboxylase
MANLKLTLALSHYDRHIPFLDGSVQLEGIDLTVLMVGQSHPLKHGSDRHERMLQKAEFDVAEVSLSSYLMARSRGMPFVGIPVFPRRLFSQSQMWVHTKAGIESPRDLIGKTVGLSTFQTTLSVLAKGDLQAEYQVPWRQIKWIVSKEEAIPFKAEQGVSIQLAPPGKKMGKMLQEGSIDALFVPHPPKEALDGVEGISRLFSDPKKAEAEYYRRNNFYPIMHVVVSKEQVLRDFPWVARSIMDGFEKAKELTKQFYDDPNWSRLVWGRQLFEEERTLFGDDPWPNGIKRNQTNLERFMRYSLDQGLMENPMTVDELFHSTTLDT